MRWQTDLDLSDIYSINRRLNLLILIGALACPANNAKLVVHSDKSSPARLAVRFVPVEGFGHFGCIEHVSSGKIVHPRGGSLDPDNNTGLVYHSDHHAGALFAFDEENERIMHRGGKIWQP